MVFNRLSDFVKLLTQNKKSKKKRNVSFQNIPFGQFFLLLLFIVVISILIYIQIILDSDKIYANIFIDGYHVGGLERSEALKLIKENMDTSYLEDYLALYTAESEYELYFRTLIIYLIMITQLILHIKSVEMEVIFKGFRNLECISDRSSDHPYNVL